MSGYAFEPLMARPVHIKKNALTKFVADYAVIKGSSY